MVSDELVLAERRRFVCGFKVAMRLMLLFSFTQIFQGSPNRLSLGAMLPISAKASAFTRCMYQEDIDIAEKYRDSVDALMDSLNPKQKKWFEAYQEMVSEPD